MTKRQRFMYLDAASKAHMELQSQLSIDDFRHEEVGYALGISGTNAGGMNPDSRCRGSTIPRKGFAQFDNFDLSKCLVHFWTLAKGERLAPENIALLALERLQFSTASESAPINVRAIWDDVAPQQRATVMRNRFKIVFFEELALMDYKTIVQVVWTLERVAKSHPARSGTSPAAANRECTRMDANREAAGTAATTTSELYPPQAGLNPPKADKPLNAER